jgi:hypothetical protein
VPVNRALNPGAPPPSMLKFCRGLRASRAIRRTPEADSRPDQGRTARGELLGLYVKQVDSGGRDEFAH